MTKTDYDRVPNGERGTLSEIYLFEKILIFLGNI